MRTCAYLIALAALFVISPAMAGFTAGQSPFFNFAGTGDVDENATSGAMGWTNDRSNSLANSPRCPVGNGALIYTETWTTPQTLGTMLLVTPLLTSAELGSSGEIWVNTSPLLEAENWTMVKPFDLAVDSWGLLDVNQTNVYGVQLKVTGGDPANQVNSIGSIGFFSERFEDAAHNKKTIWQVDTSEKGNVTNWKLGNLTGDRFLSNANNPLPQFVGVDFDVEPGEGLQLQGLLIETAQHTAMWAWDDFDVQVYRNGTWDAPENTLGHVTGFLDGDMIWIDFGPGGEYAEAVRLFGYTNTGGGQKQINGIMVFEVVPVPEPMTMTLLTLGGLSLLRRRVR